MLMDDGIFYGRLYIDCWRAEYIMADYTLDC